ncbi:probable mediator of RNA polymerase II transcription subunit 26c [Phoenix dactylifera]|uniref:Probable mediator of RNA polymerase II transcription subunit 26c n=1 Tax=Phoenix dactylifera TaxID=42345 RepID=A0A8B7BM93_PHODC|nr:probable mediator of RNA polymerase II transcription subunit 26c [Phoenix dactylifera]XP_008781433.2 probable mediator of RNA polymerase II transcription subunit 26c [Phoenix dactylifera]
MDAEDLRRVMRSMGVDLWTLIETALDVAATDYGKELRARRDGIVERLYAAGLVAADGCRNCAPGAAAERLAAVGLPTGGVEGKGSSSPAAGKGATAASPLSMNGDEKGEEREGEDDDHPIDDKTKILAIKEFLEDPDQTEDSLVSLLQNLADMEITFQNLKETDIGRHVNGFRKHPSPEVRQLVKLLVRRWKHIVDEWVKSSSAGDTASPANITDGDSPQQIPVKNSNQNGHHQASEFGYSPYPPKGYVSSERNGGESVEPKPKAAPRKEVPAKPNRYSPPSAASPPANANEQRHSLLDPERLASARRRLHENYQEAQNAKKQRTIQVMDIHEIPKPKNSFVRNKGSGFQAKHW